MSGSRGGVASLLFEWTRSRCQRRRSAAGRYWARTTPTDQEGLRLAITKASMISKKSVERRAPAPRESPRTAARIAAIWSCCPPCKAAPCHQFPANREVGPSIFAPKSEVLRRSIQGAGEIALYCPDIGVCTDNDRTAENRVQVVPGLVLCMHCFVDSSAVDLWRAFMDSRPNHFEFAIDDRPESARGPTILGADARVHIEANIARQAEHVILHHRRTIDKKRTRI